MAYRRRYRGGRRITRIYNIRRSFGRRFRRGRRYGSGFNITKSPVYYAGAAVGAFTQLDDKHSTLLQAIATCPVSIRGRGLGTIFGMAKSFSKGAVFGEAVTTLAGVNAKTETIGPRIRSAFGK